MVMYLPNRFTPLSCLLLVYVFTVEAASGLPPGFSQVKRSLSCREVEELQLPPADTWKPFKPPVTRLINGVTVSEPQTRGWAFYGRDNNGKAWISVTRSPDGTIIAADSDRVIHAKTSPGAAGQAALVPRWWFFNQGAVIDINGTVIFDVSSTSAWRFFWINADSAKADVESLYRADLEDSFMRLKFGADDRWTVANGAWQLKQYGGGMPTTEAEARSANYRRASNAFTLVGSGGEAVYGRERWINLHAEGRVFFGRPDSFARRDTLMSVTLGGEPTYADKAAIYKSDQIYEYPETDFFIVQGARDGFRAAFGWSQERGAFQLKSKPPHSERWRTLREWRMRPHFTNWVRIGLSIARGTRAMPFLDGEQLGTYRLDAVVHGPISLLSGPGGKTEWDDVKVWSYPKPRRLGAPVFEQSTNFAQKELLAKKDKQTGQWTRSELTFEEDEAKVRGRDLHLQRCQFPIYGDFTYRASPDLPNGRYFLAIVNERERPFYQIFLQKNDQGWEVPGKSDRHFTLEIGRRKGYLGRRIDDHWDLLSSRRVNSTAWLVIGAENEQALSPSHHLIYSRRLNHDLFEDAPTDWFWREGNFRMDVRWQCQRGWNFMMGKSRDVAVMYSKNTYEGDQEIEFYIALRFVTPPPYYVLRDMGFAFCTDGRSLASGYTLIYGDKDNTTTTLLRNGKPVAESRTIIAHKPGGNIHNYWWHGRVRRRGKRITIEIDDRVIFDYSDPSPLKGGHVAFWTFRNAISLAKVSINAEEAEVEPAAFRAPVTPLVRKGWRPLNPDQVAFKQLSSGKAKAENRIGGGTFALRYDLPGNGLDMRRYASLFIPLRCDRGAKVGIHLQASGKSFYYPYTAPKQGLRYLLTPEQDAAEPVQVFRCREWTQARLKAATAPGSHTPSGVRIDLRALARAGSVRRLESITVGNSSNHNYLMLGATGNEPGTSYTVGRPEPR